MENISSPQTSHRDKLIKLDWAMEEYLIHGIRTDSQIDRIRDLRNQCEGITIIEVQEYCISKKMTNAEAKHFLRVLTYGVNEL